MEGRWIEAQVMIQRETRIVNRKKAKENPERIEGNKGRQTEGRQVLRIRGG